MLCTSDHLLASSPFTSGHLSRPLKQPIADFVENWGRGRATVKPRKSVTAHLCCKRLLLCSDMDGTTCSIKQKKHGNNNANSLSGWKMPAWQFFSKNWPSQIKEISSFLILIVRCRHQNKTAVPFLQIWHSEAVPALKRLLVISIVIQIKER